MMKEGWEGEEEVKEAEKEEEEGEAKKKKNKNKKEKKEEEKCELKTAFRGIKCPRDKGGVVAGGAYTFQL